jgi:anti-sigma factor RsiW
MAYADGELSMEGRREFEGRMLAEPKLGRFVAEHRALEILARHAAPPEPIDTEWRLRGTSFVHGRR